MHHVHRLSAATLLVALTVSLLAMPATAASTSSGCTTPASSDTNLTLTSPTATGSTLTGTTLDVLAAWNTPAWAEKATLWMCLTTSASPNPAASSGYPVVAQDGSFSTALTVPSDLAPGTDLCVRGVLVGRQSDTTPATETSNALCFRTAATSSPSTTTTVTTAASPATSTTTTTTATIAVTTAGTTPPPGRPTAVLPTVTSAPAPRPELPRTGRSVDILTGVAAAFLALGTILRLIGRRRSVSVASAYRDLSRQH